MNLTYTNNVKTYNFAVFIFPQEKMFISRNSGYKEVCLEKII